MCSHSLKESVSEFAFRRGTLSIISFDGSLEIYEGNHRKANAVAVLSHSNRRDINVSTAVPSFITVTNETIEAPINARFGFPVDFADILSAFRNSKKDTKDPKREQSMIGLKNLAV